MVTSWEPVTAKKKDFISQSLRRFVVFSHCAKAGLSRLNNLHPSLKHEMQFFARKIFRERKNLNGAVGAGDRAGVSNFQIFRGRILLSKQLVISLPHVSLCLFLVGTRAVSSIENEGRP